MSWIVIDHNCFSEIHRNIISYERIAMSHEHPKHWYGSCTIHHAKGEDLLKLARTYFKCAIAIYCSAKNEMFKKIICAIDD